MHQQLMELSNDSVVIIQQSGVVYTNSVYKRTAAFVYGEQNQTKLIETIVPDSQELLIQYLQNCNDKKSSPKKYEAEVKIKNKKRFFFSVTIGFIQYLTRPSLVAVLKDTTEEKLVKEKLKASEQKYYTILENIEDGYYEVDIAGNFTFFNDAMARILGYSHGELKGMNYQNYMDKANAEIVYRTFNKVYITGTPYKAFNWELIRKDGSKRVVEVSISLIKEEAGTVMGFRGIARDITFRKLAEKEKLLAQQYAAEQEKNALLGQVAGKMAHDFNNILGVIMGNSELSLMECTDEKARETFNLILHQVERGKNITNNLTVFAKDHEPSFEFIDVNEKIDLVVTLSGQDLENVELVFHLKENLPDMFADPGMIEYTVINLLQNAVHATSRVAHPIISIRTDFVDNSFVIEVADNGCGIPREHAKHIFIPSFTLKGSSDTKGFYKKGIKGAGYGLSNCKKYIEKHNGQMKFESEVGKGTKVTITLPFVQKEAALEKGAYSSIQTNQTGKRILIVEDEKSISDVQCRLLTKAPFCHKVDVAENGHTAMDMFKRKKYDLISLDYILPDALNGIDVYEYIRKRDDNVPILFISGNIEFIESIKTIKQKDPLVEHLTKPCKNSTYLNNANRLLAKKTGATV